MKRIAYAFAVLLLCVAAVGCNVSKKVVKTESRQPTIVETPHPQMTDDTAERLGIKIDKSDKKDMSLYTEAVGWLGVPYKYAGNTKSGCDCSGMVVQIYKTVYGKTLERNSAKIMEHNCRELDRKNLVAGDLVFFATGGDGRINHVGIYLKDEKFIHASSSRGVIVSALTESYYQRTYICSGRVK